MMDGLFENLTKFIEQENDLYNESFTIDRNLIKPTKIDSAGVSVEDEWQNSSSLRQMEQEINGCQKCSLAASRNHFVFGEGNRDADIMLVGEAPGGDEDRLGRPFVGAAGQLLEKILAAIKLSREEVYICNLLKCWPPQNRDPLPDEIALCLPYLMKQIDLVKPEFILCLGRFAAQTLLNTHDLLSSLRGRFHKFASSHLLVTYHPAALLRYPQYKRPTWEDVQLLQERYLKFKNRSD